MPKSYFRFNKELISESKYAQSQDFHKLMKWRIRNILLVSSLYDSYIFEEEGRLYELIRREYEDLNLNNPPELYQISNGEIALEELKNDARYDLIIVTLHIEDMNATSLAKKIRKLNLNIPIVLLGYDNNELVDIVNGKDASVFDNIFLWQGDYRILLGIVKVIEDKFNIENDTNQVGVQTIILIEDNIKFYSSYLPLIYTEILKQSHNLISESVNLQHKFLRIRARPKIILCCTFEEAMYYFDKYEEFILGVISDIDFKRKGKSDKQAGIRFSKKVKARKPDIPILLQSNEESNEELAKELQIAFLLKNSPTLNHKLRDFIKYNFSFGDFIFKDLNGEVVGVAKDLKELEKVLARVPLESVKYHAERNHFSIWLKARTEFWLAKQLRPQKISDFESIDELRDDIIDKIRTFRKSRQKSAITDFDVSQLESRGTIMRIGTGSIGGKARGLGFVNSLIYNFNVHKRFKNIEIFVPSAIILSTDIFDKFLEENNLFDFALNCNNDEEIIKRFKKADRFPFEAVKDITAFLETVNTPLAIRSSSLLEDSQGQPFAGVYDTFMIPNNNPNIELRIYQLLNMVKLVYASTFLKKTKDYIKVTSYRLEEEKMAVIIQKNIGAEHNGKYYPEFSGVAKSYNFYPTPPMASFDGIASVALGLGRTIVEGGAAIRFCPRYPSNNIQYGTIDDLLKYGQKKFFALSLKQTEEKKLNPEDLEKKYDLYEAYKDGTMTLTGSSYSPENNALYDGVGRDGIKVFTMAPIIKHNLIPLPEILDFLLKMGSWGMSAPVEIEFAVNLSVPRGKPYQFGILQMRPLVLNNEQEELDIHVFNDENLICKSDNSLGNGVISDLKDIIFVDIDKFDRANSKKVATEIERINSKLIHENKNYILIGVGRWGSLDHWLGIPVKWEQISGARVIVESNFKNFSVAPSQGSHFFQNLTSFKIAYLTVDPHKNRGFIDWKWLRKQNPDKISEEVFHIKLKQSIRVKVNGQTGEGIILKPESKK